MGHLNTVDIPGHPGRGHLYVNVPFLALDVLDDSGRVACYESIPNRYRKRLSPMVDVLGCRLPKRLRYRARALIRPALIALFVVREQNPDWYTVRTMAMGRGCE